MKCHDPGHMQSSARLGNRHGHYLSTSIITWGEYPGRQCSGKDQWSKTAGSPVVLCLVPFEKKLFDVRRKTLVFQLFVVRFSRGFHQHLSGKEPDNANRIPDSGYVPDSWYPAGYPVAPDIRYSPNVIISYSKMLWLIIRLKQCLVWMMFVF